jgi:hypothetical protein
MTAEEFHELAWPVCEGNAPADEVARLEEAMAEDPQRREVWLEMRRERHQLRSLLGDLRDLEGPSEKLPETVREQLHAGGLGAGHRGRWWFAAGLAAALAVAVLFWRLGPVSSSPGTPASAGLPAGYLLPLDGAVSLRMETGLARVQVPTPVRTGDRVESGTAWLLRLDGQTERLNPGEIKPVAGTGAKQRWLAVPLAQLAGATRGQGAGRLLAPRGSTILSEPLIIWEDPAHEKCEVRLVCLTNSQEPEGRVPEAISPVPFGQLGRPPLRAGEIYEVSVRSLEREYHLERARFVVVEHGASLSGESDDPLRLVQAAVAALQDEPARRGDAWLLWQRMPEPWRNSELGRRIETESRAH